MVHEILKDGFYFIPKGKWGDKAQGWFRLLQKTLFFGYDVRFFGVLNVPKDEPLLIVANHTSHLDTLFITFLLWRLGVPYKVVAAEDHFFKGKIPFVGLALNVVMGVVPFDRKKGLAAARKEFFRLKEQNCSVLIFPEGTRATDGKPAKFKSGVGVLQKVTQYRVLPVYIDGAYEAWPKDGLPKLGGQINIHVGVPIEFPKGTEVPFEGDLPAGVIQEAKENMEMIHREVVALASL